jgi:hypothetical protein
LPKKSIFIGSGIVLLACCALMAGVGLWQAFNFLSNPALTTALANGLDIPTSTPIPVINRTPVATSSLNTGKPTREPSPAPTGDAAPAEETVEAGASPPKTGQASPQLSTEQILTRAVLPERDQRLLAGRLKHKGREIPQTAAETRSNYQLGDTDTFWVTNNQTTPPQQFEAKATLKYVTDHSYWWIQDGFNVNEEALQRSAERFENQTYPTNRAFFGSEWSPGVDNDARVHIFMGNAPGVAGYFSASNSYSILAEPYSNEREMFFINLNAITPGNDYFDGVLAHEFQHMIHWHQDRNEDTWVNEGLSELATFVNGYGSSDFVGAFVNTPDTQLTSWGDAPGASLANYGGSFLFMAYFLQRYGETMMQAVVANPQSGVAGFNAALAEHGHTERFDDVFADYLIANTLNDTAAGNGLWGYRDIQATPVSLTERYSVYPAENQTTVYQYGGDYIELSGNGNLTIEFTGSTRVNVVNNQPHSGRFQWYSHRGDETNTRLTRAFTLTGVTTATLTYWTWYDIEQDWDYGYVEISSDGGQSWTILQAPHSATTNPTGNAYGAGYTGTSGDNGPAWIEEQLDLSAYTGQEVLVRFEYVTDDAVNRPGWTIDDISIPEIGFFDDVESDAGAWQAEGFVRMDNILPQHFLVQVIEIGESVNVRQLPLDETNYGALTINGLGSTIDRAILIVSGLTPITTEPASYEYKLNYAN